MSLQVGLTGRRCIESAENVEESAFAATTGAGNGHNLPWEDFQGNPPKGMNLGIPGGVGFMKIAGFEHKKGVYVISEQVMKNSIK